MEDPKIIHALDQCLAIMSEAMEHAPFKLKKFYDHLIESGFNEQQALFLTAECLKKIIAPGM